MTVGNQPTVTQINATLTSYAIQMRNLCQQIANLNMSVAALGTAGLEDLGGTGAGFSASDAASVVSYAAILNTIAAVYAGTATQAAEYNFDNALCPLWAAQ